MHILHWYLQIKVNFVSSWSTFARALWTPIALDIFLEYKKKRLLLSCIIKQLIVLFLLLLCSLYVNFYKCIYV